MASDQEPPRKSAPKNAPAPNGRTKYQTGTVETLSRKQIQLAAYNPRQASKEARRRIRDNLKKVGLIGPALVWNKRTKNLVSGHLRLAALDVLEGNDDYKVDMTVVDWPIEKEKAQNVFFNNQWAQGAFDLEALGALLAADLDHLEDFGLDPVEIQHLFPDDDRFGDLFSDPEPENTNAPDAKAALDEIDENKDEERAVEARERQIEKQLAAEHTKQRRAEQGAVMDEANAADFYVVVVCKDGAQCGKVLDALGADPNSRYISAELVLRALREAEAGDAVPQPGEAAGAA